MPTNADRQFWPDIGWQYLAFSLFTESVQISIHTKICTIQSVLVSSGRILAGYWLDTGRYLAGYWPVVGGLSIFHFVLSPIYTPFII